VRLDTDSRIDLTGIHFTPHMAYDTIMGQPAPLDPDGNPAIVLTPTLTSQIYPQNMGGSTAAYVPWTVPTTLPANNLQLWVRQAVTITNPAIPTTYTTNIALEVKQPGQRLAKQRVDVRNGAVSGTNRLDVHIPVTPGETLYFEADATTPDTFDMASLSNMELVAETISGTVPYDNIPFDAHAGIPTTEAFGGGFRSWYFGQYNGTDATGPIDESKLRLPQDQNDDATNNFVQMIPFVDQGQWSMQDPDCWISGDQMSATRFGRKNLSLDTGLGGGRGVIRMGGAENEGASVQVPYVGGSGSSGTNWSTVDFLDFNGDGYPDVVGNGKVQATLPNGALAPAPVTVGGCSGDCSKVRSSKSESLSVNVGTSASHQISNSQGELLGIFADDVSFNIGAGLVGSSGDYQAQWDLIDINGDGLPDLVRQGSAGQGGLQVQLNLGNRFGAVQEWASPSTECTALVPAGLPQMTPDPKPQLRCEKSVSVGATAGVGLSDPSQGTAFGFNLGAGASDSLSMSDAQLDLVDVNGDGLPDIVSKRVSLRPVDLQHLSDTLGSDAPMHVRFNTGSGFTDWLTDTGTLNYALRSNVTHSFSVGVDAGVSIPLPICAFLCSIDIGASYSHAHTLGGFSTMLADLDGDGLADHIYSDNSGNVVVSLNNSGRTNLLRTVHRPLGGRIDLEYARSGDTSDQPGNRWVLSKVSTYDGHPGDGDVVMPPPPDQSSPITVTQISTISYQGGKYDRAEREFYGFRTVTTSQIDPANPNTPYRSVVSTYKNDNYYDRGLLESEVDQDGAGHKFTETINTYDMATVAAGRGGDLEDFTATRFPRLVRTDQRFYEGQANPGQSTYKTYGYDALGNVTQYFDAGGDGAQDDLSAAITYSSCTATNVVGKAAGITVTSNGAEVRRRDAVIDCATGNVTRVSQYLAGGAAAQTDLDYFSNGNLQRVTGPANATGQRYQVAYTYDPDVQTFITGITDSFGYSSGAVYNLKYGQVEAATDINSNVTSYTYDNFGRVETVRGPYEQSPQTPPTIQFIYHPEAGTPWALTRHYDPYRSADGTDTLDTVLFTDGFKRVLQTKKDGTIFTGPTSAAQDVMLVSGRVNFDFAGRTVKQYYPITEPLPSTEDGKGVFNETYDTITPTVMLYDVLDRNTQTTLPDGTSTTTTYGFGADRSGANRFQTNVQDANNVQTNTFKDVRGLVTSVEEFHNGQPVWTSYGYDPMSELVQVTDDHNNVTHAAYDNLGRTVSEDNPDTGRTDMTYDLAGNLTTKATANLRAENSQITYAYDYNHLTSLTYPDQPGNNVTYNYGGVGASDNRAGRIATVTDGSGSEDRYYGKLGEVVRQVKSVNTTTGPSPAVYTTSYVYDTWGRVQNMTYPDGEVLTYTYDSGGQPDGASGVKGGRNYDYVDRMEYDKFELKVFVQDGNGIKSQYTFRQDNRRLSGLQAGQGQGNAFQNLSYTYDAVGNVLNVTNNVPVAPPSQFGGPTSQTFSYDDLYRLTSATGAYQFAANKSRQYNMSVQYDTINDIVSKQQSDNVVQNGNQSIPQHKTTYSFAYAYAGTQPHAPTHIDDRTFTYDANGNQTGWTDDQTGQRRSIVWDEENRIQSISDNGHQETYKYDYSGTRVIKRGPQGETVYVNPYFTIRNGQIGTKNVYMGSARIVSKMMQQDPQAQERDLYFYHPDNLGSSNYVTDANGQLYEHLEYFPFGETWVQESSNTQRAPYLFTSKELDKETGLYYYGARYFDPRTSVWQSPDPALPAYLSGKPNGGVFNPGNLSMYTYAMDNPVRFTDPTGMSSEATQETAAETGKEAEKSGGVKTEASMIEHTETHSTDIAGIPWESTQTVKVMTGGASTEDGVGLEGHVANVETVDVIGTKTFGVYIKTNQAVDSADAVAGVEEGNLVLKVGADFASGDATLGLNIYGLRIGFMGEGRFGFEASLKAGENGVETSLGPMGFGLDLGLAAGEGDNPLVDLVHQKIESFGSSFHSWFSQMTSGGLGSWAASSSP
jgi:RHS repeat-associated protein